MRKQTPGTSSKGPSGACVPQMGQARDAVPGKPYGLGGFDQYVDRAENSHG